MPREPTEKKSDARQTLIRTRLRLSLLKTGACSNTSLSARTETGAEETPVHIVISGGGISLQTNAAYWGVCGL